MRMDSWSCGACSDTSGIGTEDKPSAALPELLAQRTIAALVDTYGITATIATKAVHGLSDKGDVEAAVDACRANSSTTREEAGAKRRPPVPPHRMK